jgi:hypothetical protein
MSSDSVDALIKINVNTSHSTGSLD